METKYRVVRITAKTRRTLKMLKKWVGCHSIDELINLLCKIYIQMKGGVK